jgi:PQQ-like domain
MHHPSRRSRHLAHFATTGLTALSLSLTFCSSGKNGAPRGDAGAQSDISAETDAPAMCSPSPSTLAFVQVAAATPQTPVATVSLQFPHAEGAGHLNVVVVAWNDTTHAVHSVTDSNHNAYTPAIGPTVGASITQSIYYAADIATGSNTVTVTFDAAVDSPDVRVLEYSGVAASKPVDQTAAGTGAGANASTTLVTTTSPNELLVAAGTTSGAFSGPGTGFTERIITTPDGDIAEDEVVSKTGTYSGTAPQSGNWVMQLVTFRAASSCSGGGGPGSVTLSPRAAGITPTQTEQFTATVVGATKTGVTWAVDGVSGGNTTVGTISSAGLYTPPNSAGVHTVTATRVADTKESASASVAVTTLPGVFSWHNDSGLTGQNLEELALTLSSVNSNQFGKLFSQTIDGYAYAQPLWVSGVSFGSVKHNVAYVATENNSVYAFDADTNQPALWRTSLGTPVPDGDTGDTADLIPQIGTTGTPVIDPTTNTLYVVAETKDAGPTYHHRLHALDLSTGAEKFGGPVVINPSVPGTGGNSSGGNVLYSPIDHFQRPSLLLLNGVVYVPIGSSADTNPGFSHGWVVGYGATTLKQVMAYSTSPNGTMASIWSSGGGIAVDSSGNMYFETGNGSFDANTGGSDYGDSVVKLNASGTVLDYFTPFNQATLSNNDIDLGSAAAVVLPDQSGPVPHELIATGKPGYLFVVNRDDMGHFQSGNNNQIVQSVDFGSNTTSNTGGSYGTIAYYDGSVYFADAGTTGDGKLKAYRLSGGLLSTSPTSESSVAYGYPGATPSISADGTKNGIVWALQGQGYTPSTAPVLHAYDATSMANELYNSEQEGSRDTPGPAVKFVVPTVANGKVYVPTQTELTVFGLLP